MFQLGAALWLSVVVIVVLWGALRSRVSVRTRRECARLLPPENQLSWRMPSDGGRTLPKEWNISLSRQSDSSDDFARESVAPPEGPRLWAPVTGAAFADGLLAGLPVIQAVSHIDPFVLKAIEESTADHIHSFPSVHSYVEQHFFAAPTMTADGWFERLTGYVAEQKAASALEAAGHHVTFAATANQPVWDLMVDGHPVQIKEGLSGVKAFLVEHHGIPVYTGPDAAAAVKDPLVHGIVGLNSAEIHESAHTSIEGISDTFDPGFHFPIITLAFAGYREIKLLIQERTTLGRATKHVGLDVAGVGVGAFGGAKAGALAGAFLGPFGAAIGGLLGAVAGGVGGKLLATSIRHAPFNEARAIYEEAIDSAQLAIGVSVNESRDKVRLLQSDYDAQFSKSRELIIHRANTAIRSYAVAYEGEFTSFAENFESYLDLLAKNLDEQKLLLLASVPSSGIIRMLYPTNNDHLRGAIRLWFRKAKRTIRDEKKSFQAIEPRTLAMLRPEIERFLNDYVFELESLDTEIGRLVQSFSEAQTAARTVANAASEELQREREGLISKFAQQAEKLHAGIAELIHSCNQKISARKARFIIEGRAVGLDI